jgi:hypothetical protein
VAEFCARARVGLRQSRKSRATDFGSMILQQK